MHSQALVAFTEKVGAPRALRDFGLRETDVDRAADLAMQAHSWNPPPLVRDKIRGRLRSVWTGEVEAEAEQS